MQRPKRSSFSKLHRCVVVEPLELRKLRSATLDGGVLQVGGTAGNDRIHIEVDGSDPTQLRVRVNAEETLFDAADVNEIRVEARRGNDSVDFARVTVRAKVYGGAGDDSLTAGDPAIFTPIRC